MWINIFNISQRTVKLNPAWDMLKIMWKNRKIIMMHLQYLTAVEKHLASNETLQILEFDSENPVITVSLKQHRPQPAWSLKGLHHSKASLNGAYTEHYNCCGNACAAVARDTCNCGIINPSCCTRMKEKGECVSANHVNSHGRGNLFLETPWMGPC